MRWTGVGLLALGAAVAAAMLLREPAERLMVERGALSVWLAVDLALPLAGLGLTLAVVPAREGMAGLLLFGVGLFVGFFAREWLISSLVTGSATLYRLRLIGPVACLAAGGTLISPAWVRRGLLPLAAVAVGVLLGLAITLKDPSFHDRSYPRGAIAAATWLVVGIALAGRPVNPRWLGIAARIFASWLLAVGLLLGGSTLARQFGGPVDPPQRRTPPPTRPSAPVPPASRPMDPGPSDSRPSGPRPPDLDPWRQP